MNETERAAIDRAAAKIASGTSGFDFKKMTPNQQLTLTSCIVGTITAALSPLLAAKDERVRELEKLIADLKWRLGTTRP